MAFLTIDGITIPVDRDTLRVQPKKVGDVNALALGGTRSRSISAESRTWRMETTWMSLARALRLQKWIEGRMQKWPFDSSSLYSGAGVAQGISGTIAYNAGGRFGGCLQVSASNSFGVEMVNKLYEKGGWFATTQGWTLGFWSYRNAADGLTGDWYHYVATGRVEFTRGAAANPAGVTQYRNGFAGSYSMGHICSVKSSGEMVGVGGYTTSGAGAQKLYDELFFFPGELTAAEVLQLYAWCNTARMGNAPMRAAAGDWIGSTPVNVFGDVEGIAQMHMANADSVGQAFGPAAKLSLVLEEA